MKHSQKSSKPADEIYPGATVDNADKDTVDPTLVKQETKILNNNPRDNDIKMP